jgi:hypothetical protein
MESIEEGKTGKGTAYARAQKQDSVPFWKIKKDAVLLEHKGQTKYDA